MSFARTYLERYASGSWTDLIPPDPDLFFSVIIPVLEEDFLLKSLQSLVRAIGTDYLAEIIIIFNHPETSLPSVADHNNLMMQQVNEWATGLPQTIKVLCFGSIPLSQNLAGPGWPRKLGMDLAVRRYNAINRGAGLIVSMDADTLVAPDFFRNLAELFQKELKANACCVYFEHPRSFNGAALEDPDAMIQYEIYLRVLKLGLHWAGYPLAIHTLGSAFTVRASAYVKSGGMGRHRSGEDFYFLHKCIQLGDFWEVNTARVYPSGRKSGRVVFGTGKFIKDYREQYPNGFSRYSWRSFRDLSELIRPLRDLSYDGAKSPFFDGMNPLNKRLVERLGWEKKLQKAFNQAGNQQSFHRWIWRQLDGLQMVHYLNLHQEESGSEPVIQSACQLLSELGELSCPLNPVLVLTKLRKVERSLGVYQVY